MLNYYRHHRSGAVHECMYCLQPFADFESMRSHVDQHGGRYTCSECGKSLDDIDAVLAHRTEHERRDADRQRRQDCGALEQEVKRGYLSCPRAKLR
jgi:5-methylcytosine-specific restriction endonuclease McrA